MRLADLLAERPYPGRGLLVAATVDGEGYSSYSALYWLTGRSEASRARTLVGDGEALSVVPSRPAGPDPLRHYRAACRAGGVVLVGNGDHVDQLAALVDDGAEPFRALCGLRPEPDGLRTPRLAALVDAVGGSVVLGAARALPGGSGADHVAVRAECLPPGWGLAVTTYAGLPEAPGIDGQPRWVEVAPSLEEELERAWGALDVRYRVALAGRSLARDGSWSVVPERAP